MLLIARATIVAGVAALVGILWLAALALLLLPPLRNAAPVGRRSAAETWQGVRQILRNPRIWLALLFALVGGTAFEAVGALVGPYLTAAQFQLESIGLFQIGPLAGAMAAEALVGGRISDRFGHVRVAWFSLALLIGFNIVLGVLGLAAPGAHYASLGLITAQYAVIGVFTASSYALLMDLAWGRWQATLFSAFMGATNACEVASTFVAGRLVASVPAPAAAPTLGFSSTFIIMTLPSLAGLAILPLLRRRA